MTIRVTIRCFAQLRELATERCDVELAPGATTATAWAALAERFAAIEPHRRYVRAARNGVYTTWDEPLADDDVIAFLPPVSGGASAALVEGPIDAAALERAVAGPELGAVVTFIGRARSVADDGRTVLELDYEVYEEMAEAALSAIAAEAEVRFGAVVAVAHRHGRVPIGEAAVVIATAAMHRDAAYEANRHVIEAIKQRLPIWKRERFADGTEWKRPGA